MPASTTRTFALGLAAIITIVVAPRTAQATIFNITSGTTTDGTLYTDGNISGGLIKQGAGTLVLTNNGNSYTSQTVVQGGTLALSGAAAISNAGVNGGFGAPTGANSVIDLFAGTTLQLRSTSPRVNQTTDRTINLAGTTPGTMSLRVNDNDTIFRFGAVTTSGTGAKTLALFTGAQGNGDRESLIFDGVISDTLASPLSLGVTFRTQTAAASHVSLKSGGTFTGNINLLPGSTLGTGFFTVGGEFSNNSNHNGTLGQQTIGTGTLGGGNYSGDIAIGSDKITFKYFSSADQILTGDISGAGNLTMSGTNTLTLAGTNTYTGTTVIDDGLLELAGSIQSTSNLIFSGGMLELGSSGLINVLQSNYSTVDADNDILNGLIFSNNPLVVSTFNDGTNDFTQIAAVPEPASIVLWSILGLAGFGYYRMKWKK